MGPSDETERACETQGAHPSLTVAHPAREIRVLERHGVGEGESELGADFTHLVFAKNVYFSGSGRSSSDLSTTPTLLYLPGFEDISYPEMFYAKVVFSANVSLLSKQREKFDSPQFTALI